MLTVILTMLATACSQVSVAGSYLVPVTMATTLSAIGAVLATKRGYALVKSSVVENLSSRNWRRLKVVAMVFLAGLNAVVLFDSLERMYWIIDLGKY